MTALLHLPVGEAGLGIAAAAEAAAVAAANGVPAVRLPDRPDLLDPSLVAARLSPAAPGLGFVLEASTGEHAPYNLARRLASLARAHDGAVGVALRAGGLDPLTRRHSGGEGEDAAAVWREYVQVLRSLWASFPVAALLGDAGGARFADVDRIAPPGHRGEHYRVAGALNVPTDPARSPVLVVDDPELDRDGVADVHVGTRRGDGPTLGRVLVSVAADEEEGLRRLRPLVAGPGRRVVAGTAGHVVEELLTWRERDGLTGFDVATYPGLRAFREAAENVVPRLVAELAPRQPAGVAR